MKQILKSIAVFILFSLILTANTLAGSDMAGKGHDMSGHESQDRIGELFHESTVQGYMLSYYLMDLRKQKSQPEHDMDNKDMDNKNINKSHDMDDKAHDMKQMDKPHHIMVYIMDKNHAPVLKGKIGFLIKDGQGNVQKTMAMYMSQGFGITADMRKKGVYTISAKAVLGDVKLKDSFEYEIK